MGEKRTSTGATAAPDAAGAVPELAAFTLAALHAAAEAALEASGGSFAEFGFAGQRYAASRDAGGVLTVECRGN